MKTSDGFIGYDPPTKEEKGHAVLSWRLAAEHERFRINNGLCYGYTGTAERNAALYEGVASEIEAEVTEEE